MDMYFGWRSDISVGATHASLGMLPNASAQMAGRNVAAILWFTI